MLLLGSPVIADIPSGPNLVERVDLVEVNHYYNFDGDKVFSQLIFWERTNKGPQVLMWRMEGEVYREGKTVIWLKNGILCRVRVDCLVETYTQFDREVEQRKFLSPTERKGLFPWIPE